MVAGPVLTADSFSLLALVYLGVVTMAVGYLLLFAGLSTASASAAAVATLIEPVTATALEVVLLGDRLTALAITGIVSNLASATQWWIGQLRGLAECRYPKVRYSVAANVFHVRPSQQFPHRQETFRAAPIPRLYIRSIACSI